MKRTAAIFLLLVILVSGCQDREANNSDSAAEPIGEAVSESITLPAETEEETEAPITDDLPDDLDYNGYSFQIYTFGGGNTGTTNQQYLDVEGITGEVVNDAAYSRNLEVEERLNIEIGCVEGSNQFSDLNANANAGDSAFDLVNLFVNDSADKLILKNILYDVKKMKYIDTQKPYYDQQFMETFTICGAQYLMGGSYPYTVSPPCFFLFNKEKWENLNLENPYQLVYEGKWMHDKLCEIVKDTYIDQNGNGEYDDEDFYGLDSVPVVLRALYPAYGGKVMTVDGTEYTIEVENETSFDIVSKIVNLATDPSVHLATGDRMWMSFIEGNSLMLYYGSNIYRLRDIEFDFGWLPTPKYNEEQNDYRSYKLLYPICVPSNVTDLDRTGAVCEALFSTSEKYMTDAFIRTYAENKVLRDEDSQILFRRSMKNAVYDFTSYFQVDGLKISDFRFVGDLITRKSTDLASYYASVQTSVTKSFDKFFDKIKENLG